MGHGSPAGAALMRWRADWRASETLPEREAVLSAVGLPRGAEPPPRIGALLEEAMEIYRRLAEPRAVLGPVDAEAFANVYRGEGRNERETPLADIFPKAGALALFAATVGAPVAGAIGELFARREPALGYMLDAVASQAADGLAYAAGRELIARLDGEGRRTEGARVLPYSPGYCGWHLTGQRALFAALGPGEIGIALNEGCLMQPLKSVSGVLVVGPAAIHQFSAEYPCCESCGTRQCYERIASLGETPWKS